MHLVFVQFGDYREAFERFEKGSSETYYAQRYSVDFVGKLVLENCVTVVCVAASQYDVQLKNGVRAIGLRLWSDTTLHQLTTRIEAMEPTHIILCFPATKILRWAVRRRLPILPLLADTFTVTNIRTWWRRLMLVHVLKNKHITTVANHNVPAAEQLIQLGVPARKVIPWDWPPQITPDDFEPKSAPRPGQPIRLFYAGLLRLDKGVGDCIEAVQHLRRNGLDVTLTIAGSGPDRPRLEKLVRRDHLNESVTFLGNVPHDRIAPMMHEHTFVLVCSHHRYPEGLPMTVYEALCARTPVIFSDHPVFARLVASKPEIQPYVPIFKACHHQELAETIQHIIEQPEDYDKLSQGTEALWKAIQCPTKWGDLILEWLHDSAVTAVL